ncbi:translation initiation factor eIF-2A [Meredithblackwellia eburnea MCA 4105]
MAAAFPQTQYAFRSLKQLGLTNGPPTYQSLDGFQKPDAQIRTYRYSPDGRFFAFASSLSVQVISTTTSQPISELPLKNVIDLSFSPNGTQISTWERQVKQEDGQPGHRNMKVWNAETGEELAAWGQKAQDGWALQYTPSSHLALRLAGSELQVYDTSDFAKGPIDKVKIDGVSSFKVSPNGAGKEGEESVAVFCGEKKGAPASLKIHPLSALSKPTSSKTFFKADKIQIKWNSAGTSVLFLTQTEVDKTGQSYYGETNLYLMTKGGEFDCRVSLDKEGGIHDFDWSPNDQEFVVTYGYMPAKTVIFNTRVKILHDFGSHPRNFLAYNPQGRLLCIAGFGNLAGQVDIWDRRTLKKVATIDAPNTSHCEWSPDGRYLLCATLSPRLRVDNGMRFFHFTGSLMHIESIEELYQASWRPADASLFPFGQTLEPAPAASASAVTATPVKVAAPAGAYRPPHARGTLTPTFFKREDEGGLAYSSNGTPSPYAAASSANGGARSIPGAPRRVPGAPAPSNDEEEKGGRRKKKGPGGGGKKGSDSPGGGSGAVTPVPVPEPVVAVPEPPAPAELSADDKKRRALMKKLTAIEQLKVKKANGEKLELTQYKKLDSEEEIRQELKALELGSK